MATPTIPSIPVCPTCHGPRGAHPLFCASCQRLFPEPPEWTHFDRLGTPRTYDLDTSSLEQQLFNLTRRFHPDFFAGKESEQQQLSLVHSASLNQAYATLRDPFERAEYLLHLWGGVTSSEDKRTPPGFLDEMLGLREKLEEARVSNDSGALAALHAALLERQRRLLTELGRSFRDVEKNGAGAGAEAMAAIRMALNAAKYINGLVRDSSGLHRPEV
ncbi:MAG: Fe-S protein assembly co-chaperone HscB [Planctomycetes bacterium]|nr:Fe-S protein assembly co-chaperone HscB [Planctomycetota bacterium]